MKEAIEMLMKLKEENTLPDDVVKTEDTPTEDMGLEETSLVDEREEQQRCAVEKILAEFENDFEVSDNGYMYFCLCFCLSIYLFMYLSMFPSMYMYECTLHACMYMYMLGLSDIGIIISR